MGDDRVMQDYAVTILSGWECTHKADDGDTETVRLCKAAIAKAEGRE